MNPLQRSHIGIRLLIAILGLSILSGCASTRRGGTPPAGVASALSAATPGQDFEDFEDFEDEEAAPIADPLEGINRAIYGVNDILMKALVIPGADLYRGIMPLPARQAIDNFFTNAAYPVRLVSAVAQGKDERAGLESRKFLLNTTVGIVGVFKPSGRVPELSDVPEEDLGQALAHIGIPEGPFLFLPILGPTTLRDIGGSFGGRYLQPWVYLPEWENRAIASGVRGINGLPRAADIYESITSQAVDPYTALKDGYISLRRAAVAE